MQRSPASVPSSRAPRGGKGPSHTSLRLSPTHRQPGGSGNAFRRRFVHSLESPPSFTPPIVPHLFTESRLRATSFARGFFSTVVVREQWLRALSSPSGDVWWPYDLWLKEIA